LQEVQSIAAWVIGAQGTENQRMIREAYILEFAVLGGIQNKESAVRYVGLG